MERGQEEEGGEGEEEEEEVEAEFQLTEDTEDERFKTDTLFIIEEVLSRVSSEQSSDEARDEQQRVYQVEMVGDGLGVEVEECPVEVGRVEETAGEDSGGGAGWQEVEEEEEEEEEENEASKPKTEDERLAESPAEASVDGEESPDEGISSDTSCSEGGAVNEEEEEEEEEEGPVMEEDLSEKSEGFFEAIECRSEEYAKLGVGDGLETKKRCLTEEDFGESENATKIANEDRLTV